MITLNTWTYANAFFSNAHGHVHEKRYSEWINLTKGEPYFMEYHYVEYDRSDHFSTGVEFEQTAIVNHHQAMKEVQELRIRTDQTKEKTQILVKNPDSGSFRVTFKNPKTNAFVVMKTTIKCTATAAEFKAVVKKFYWDTYRTDISVTRTDLDSQGIDITISNSTMETIRFEISVDKLVKEPTTTQIILSKVGSSSTLTAKLPSAVQLSSPPIEGKFDIVCVSEVGQESFTINLDRTTHYKWIGNYIEQQCVGMYNNIEALPCDNKTETYRENGVCVRIRFIYNKNPG